MEIYTVQSIDVLNEIQTHGIYRCNKELVPLVDIKKPVYDKYCELFNYDDYPIWGLRPDNLNIKDFLHRSEEWVGLGLDERKTVALKLEIPDELLVFTDFFDWGTVVNYYLVWRKFSQYDIDKVVQASKKPDKTNKQVTFPYITKEMLIEICYK